MWLDEPFELAAFEGRESLVGAAAVSLEAEVTTAGAPADSNVMDTLIVGKEPPKERFVVTSTHDVSLYAMDDRKCYQTWGLARSGAQTKTFTSAAVLDAECGWIYAIVSDTTLMRWRVAQSLEQAQTVGSPVPMRALHAFGRRMLLVYADGKVVTLKTSADVLALSANTNPSSDVLLSTHVRRPDASPPSLVTVLDGGGQLEDCLYHEQDGLVKRVKRYEYDVSVSSIQSITLSDSLKTLAMVLKTGECRFFRDGHCIRVATLHGYDVATVTCVLLNEDAVAIYGATTSGSGLMCLIELPYATVQASRSIAPFVPGSLSKAYFPEQCVLLLATHLVLTLVPYHLQASSLSMAVGKAGEDSRVSLSYPNQRLLTMPALKTKKDSESVIAQREAIERQWLCQLGCVTGFLGPMYPAMDAHCDEQPLADARDGHGIPRHGALGTQSPGRGRQGRKSVETPSVSAFSEIFFAHVQLRAPSNPTPPASADVQGGTDGNAMAVDEQSAQSQPAVDRSEARQASHRRRSRRRSKHAQLVLEKSEMINASVEAVSPFSLSASSTHAVASRCLAYLRQALENRDKGPVVDPGKTAEVVGQNFPSRVLQWLLCTGNVSCEALPTLTTLLLGANQTALLLAVVTHCADVREEELIDVLLYAVRRPNLALVAATLAVGFNDVFMAASLKLLPLADASELLRTLVYFFVEAERDGQGQLMVQSLSSFFGKPSLLFIAFEQQASLPAKKRVAMQERPLITWITTLLDARWIELISSAAAHPFLARLQECVRAKVQLLEDMQDVYDYLSVMVRKDPMPIKQTGDYLLEQLRGNARTFTGRTLVPMPPGSLHLRSE